MGKDFCHRVSGLLIGVKGSVAWSMTICEDQKPDASISLSFVSFVESDFGRGSVSMVRVCLARASDSARSAGRYDSTGWNRIRSFIPAQ
jgi:hypothetical protein